MRSRECWALDRQTCQNASLLVFLTQRAWWNEYLLTFVTVKAWWITSLLTFVTERAWWIASLLTLVTQKAWWSVNLLLSLTGSMVKCKPTDIPHRDYCEVKAYWHSSHRENNGVQTTDIPDTENIVKCKPTDIPRRQHEEVQAYWHSYLVRKVGWNEYRIKLLLMTILNLRRTFFMNVQGLGGGGE